MVTSTRSQDKKNGAVAVGNDADHATSSKHQMDEKPSPKSKRTKKAKEKKQKTIEEALSRTDDARGEPKAEVKPSELDTIKDGLESNKKKGRNGHGTTNGKKGQGKKSSTSNGAANEKQATAKAHRAGTGTTNGKIDPAQESNKGDGAIGGQNGSAEQPQARAGAAPASILEKGIVYFFVRGRVGTSDHPGSVEQIQRSYLVLRPLGSTDAGLGAGPIGDDAGARLVAVPKKTLPRRGRERWLALVEKAGASFAALRDEFLAASDYATKTAGTRHAPAAAPVGEGVYAITTTGRESHLAYVLTVPAERGEVQEELGLRDRGSFIISTRNPQYEAPGNVSLPRGPDYPEELLEEFRSRRWMPTTPKHLDIANTQILLVGESSGIQKATEPQKEDQENGKEEPLEELEKLEDEDTRRMEALQGDDSAAIYADLEVRAKDYPTLQTTF